MAKVIGFPTADVFKERRLTGWRLCLAQVALILGSWAVFLAIGYGAYRLLEAIWPG